MIRKIVQRFCSKQTRDTFFTFDESRITLAALTTNLNDLNANQLQEIQSYGVRRIIYSPIFTGNSRQIETPDDSILNNLFSLNWLFKGMQYDLPIFTQIGEEASKNEELQQLKALIQHFVKHMGENSKETFQLFFAIRDSPFDIKSKESRAIAKQKVNNILEYFADIPNFQFTFTLKYNPFIQLDFQADTVQRQYNLENAVDLDVYKYGDFKQSELYLNREILSTIYQNKMLDYNTIVVRNYIKQSNELVESNKLNEGIVSFSHFFDMVKLLSFRGSLVIPMNENFGDNIDFMINQFTKHKYVQEERERLSDWDIKGKSNQNETVIEVI